jgi:K+-transporting ATPase ATPase A chain
VIDWTALAEVTVVLGISIAVGPPLGSYIARVFLDRPAFGDRYFRPFERLVYRLLGVSPGDSMEWKEYLGGLVLVNAAVLLWVFLIMMFQQDIFPTQPGFHPMSWDLALHTAASFTTNTDFTHFAPETSWTLGGAMIAIFVPFFLSAASGLAVAAAFSRSFVRKDRQLGNVYVDLVRSVTRILLPISVLGAVGYILLGVPDTLTGWVAGHPPGGGGITIFLGPVAPWNAIELLGTNGGGFYAANAASPLATPNLWANLEGSLLMLLLPMAFPFAFGYMVRRPGEAYPLFGTMVSIFLLGMALFLYWDSSFWVHAAGGRFGAIPEGFFQVTSVYNNVGATNLTIGSLHPLGQMVLFFGMFTQATPGGDGIGFATLLVNVVIAVFVAGLMVGRTPEYLGKKIGLSQVRWAAFVLLIHPAAVLVPTAVTFLGGFATFPSGSMPVLPLCSSTICASGHDFSAILYEFASQSANNGSSYGYATASVGGDGSMYFNLVGAAVVLVGRFLPILGMLAIAGKFADQESQPPGSGTLRTQSLTFTLYLAFILIVVTALLFLPVIAFGPLAQLGG